MNMQLSSTLEDNIKRIHDLLPIGKSFDLVTRTLYLGKIKAFWIGINGFCKTEILQQIFSDLQSPYYTKENAIKDIEYYMNTRIGYAQTELIDNFENIILQLLSGPSVLFIDGCTQAIVIDVRNYPTRGIEEPDIEQVTRGSRDGFVETMLFNTNLIRRRIRSPKLTFELHPVGCDSHTDVVVAYVENVVDKNILKKLEDTICKIKANSLTMGTKSLEELLVKKRWYNPLPSMQITERPDVACSYLMEGHIVIIVDNSPAVIILPSTIFQFTQSPDDYYSNQIVGSYFRLVRFGCILVSLFFLPTFLLISTSLPGLIEKYPFLATTVTDKNQLVFYIIAVELILDLFKYSTAHSPTRFSGSLSLVGGLIIGDIAIQMNWATAEVLFYAAITLLTTLSLASIEFGDAFRIYRLLLLTCTTLGGLWGYLIGIVLMLISIITTPTFAGTSYFWPLFPFNWNALRTLLFRYPTYKAQPSSIWKRHK